MRALVALGVGLVLAAAAGAQPLEPLTLQAALGAPGSAAFAVENAGAAPAELELVRFQGRTIFHGLADVQAEIDALPPQLPDDAATRIFRFVTDNRRHGWYLTLDFRWFLEPTLFFNSSGLATCGENANEIMLLAADRGLTVRRMALDGHVVMEVFQDGAWHMYDGDYGVYFLNAAGSVASVEELSADPSLITAPLHPMATPGPYSPYTSDYAALYRDFAPVFGPDPTLPPRSVRFTLPPGGRLLFPGRFEHAPISPAGFALESHLDLELRLPAGYTGTVTNPLIVHTIRGRGSVALDGQSYTLGSAALTAAIDARNSPLLETEVVASEVPLSILYLVNPVRWSASGDAVLELNATPGANLVASALPIGSPDLDADFDGIPEDGDASGSAGDAPCSDGAVTGCDDNCPAAYNRSQWDADADGAGNACDGDIDQNSQVGSLDLAALQACMLGGNPSADPSCRESDLDENGVVDATDEARFLTFKQTESLSCGLGPELLLPVLLLWAARRRR